MAWLVTTFYYPMIASIIALLAGQYFFSLFGLNVNIVDFENILFAVSILIVAVIVNYYSPMIAAKFQVSATIIKLIPILFIAVAGLFASLIIGGDAGIASAFTNNAVTLSNEAYAFKFGDAIKTTAFAYEGWVCATAINAELKNSKRDLPRALTFGTIAVLIFYIIYYISLSSVLGNSEIVNQGNNAPVLAFTKLLGNFGGKIFTVFILISCLGTINGLAISCCRGMYTMSCRGLGPLPEKFSKLGKNQSVSPLSCLYGLGCMFLMLGVWILAFNKVWIFKYLDSMDKIVCAIIYGVYITMYIHMIKNFKDCNIFQRYIMPIIATIGALFFVLCGSGIYQLITEGSFESLKAFGVFLIFFCILMFPCLFFYKEDKKE